MIEIKRGLDLPIAGLPAPRIEDAPDMARVALIGPDYHGMKPTLEVSEGDRVKKGQLLFTDKKTEGVRYTAPAAGTVAGIHRGRKRAFLSLEIDVDGDEQVDFPSYPAASLDDLGADAIEQQLIDSGLWTALRTRPFSKVPVPGTRPVAIYVSAMDSQPLAADPSVILADQGERFAAGLKILKKLTTGTVYVTKHTDAYIPGVEQDGVEVRSFAGPHPAGLVGTHIHFIDPVSTRKMAWTVDPQDVLAIAALFLEGKIDTTRVVALGGPQVKSPRYLRTQLGADLHALTQGELRDGENRIISGSVLSGRKAIQPIHYLGRYHRQVSVLEEDREHVFLGWMGPGGEKHSIFNLFVSSLTPSKRFEMTTTMNGSPRAMVPVGAYEKVMPLDILPTHLLRALIIGDTDSAQQLGCLELDEEDLGLCTYVCTGKYDYGPILRKNLTQIEKEG